METIEKKKLYAGIKRQNNKFNKSGKPGKRIIIAKDIIKLLESKVISAKKRVYIKSAYLTEHRYDNMRDILPNAPTCQVCAIGAIFYAKVAITNNHSLSEIDGYDSRAALSRVLLDVFTERQMTIIEAAFESRDYGSRMEMNDVSHGVINKALEFRKENKLGSQHKTLIAIMKNIIKNNGTFKP